MSCKFFTFSLIKGLQAQQNRACRFPGLLFCNAMVKLVNILETYQVPCCQFVVMFYLIEKSKTGVYAAHLLFLVTSIIRQ